ncbi:NAD(P)/FAD-dependent oxidoreductase [Arthrobacter gandavensis]|uniref:NAD(P)/FAD-dependent oxidoreductase n=1 Tax=Arthrobacter gandavensis TaxID=169960 RepID=UPI00188F2C44|nr:NAD(P)/FAD-dependent oxidoreductase [Arthrobacter gandavensis]MBF4994535.1 NAD(P)/FAD-dependent oxidoreductase [Arthrobacter gandavensis]
MQKPVQAATQTAEYDVVIVGGAAAGLSAGLALSRARRKVAVVDSGEPRNAAAGHIHNYLGREGAAPGELYAAGREEVRSYGGTIVPGRAENVERDGDGMFRVILEDGRTLACRKVLAASGALDELPAIPGLSDYWGTAVLHCPYCHGWETDGKTLGVLASDPDAAVHQALMWRQWCADIVLFLNGTGAPGEEQERQLSARGIRVVDGPVAAVGGDGAGLAGVRLVSGEFVSRQALVVLAKLRARDGYLAGVGLAAEEQYLGDLAIGTALPAEPSGATSVPGVYAAGNLTSPMTQVIGAAAAGLATAAAINAELMAEDTAATVAAAGQGALHGHGSGPLLR